MNFSSILSSPWVSGFHLPNGVSLTVYASVVMNGELYIGGSFQAAGDKKVNNIARWNGTTWSELGSGLNGDVYALAKIGSDLYAAGYFLQMPAGFRLTI
ncbi:MAG: hypothetical protein IPL53_00115 [Ignavibacteria bacterium]|nr:hypothetical protein [Ignavibacteria bacterium]